MSILRNLGKRFTMAGKAFMSGGFDVSGGPSFYEGASQNIRLASWQETDSAISVLLAAEGDVLRQRSRALCRKNQWAKRAQDSFVANSVGTGIKPQSKHSDKTTRLLIDKYWRKSQLELDADGQQSFYGMQATMVREIFEAGEVLVRFRPRLKRDGFLVPVQLQMVPAELLAFTKNAQNGDNAVRSGIEFTPYGKRVAYWLWREHPGMLLINMLQPNFQVPVPADQVIHAYQTLRAGQFRGQVWLAPVMVTLYELDQFVDAVLVRQKLSNMFLGWQRRQNPDDSGVVVPSKIVPGTGEQAPPGVGFATVEPGTLLDMPMNDTLEFNKPPDVGAEFAVFLKAMLHAVAAGVGVPYEQITWDLERVNYSSIRAGLLEFRRQCEQFQQHVVIQQLCRPIWNRWVEELVIAGLVPSPKSDEEWDDLYAVEWRPPAWAWVDPLKDVMAKRIEVRSGFTSRTAVVHERGEDPELVDQQIADDNERSDENGTILDSDPRFTTDNGQRVAMELVAADDKNADTGSADAPPNNDLEGVD